MNDHNQILKRIAMTTGQGKSPILNIIRNSPATAAAISKLRQDPAPMKYSSGGNIELQQPNISAFRQQSEGRMQDVRDAEGVMQILPDIDLWAQILCSAVLSPKDQINIELNYAPPEGILPSTVNMEITNVIRQHFSQTYKIKESLGTILRDALVDKGAHIRAVIPENSLDEFINRNSVYGLSTESILSSYEKIFDDSDQPRHIGILGPSDHLLPGRSGKKLSLESFGKNNADTPYNYGIAFESYQKYDKDGRGSGAATITHDTYVSVTDNIGVLSKPRVFKALQESKIKGILSNSNMKFGTESFSTGTQPAGFAAIKRTATSKLTDRELSSVLFKNVNHATERTPSLKTDNQLDRKAIGNPLVMELPTESVIPVHVPGQPENHLGYFVLLDGNGNPISIGNRQDYMTDLNRMSVSGVGNGSLPSQLISRTNSMMAGRDCSMSQHLDYSQKVFSDIVIADLLSRLRNGVYTNGVELGRNDEIYRIMFARSLSQQHSQLLFIPVQLVTYFAFRFNADGVGRSLLSETKVLNALRSTLMFANTMAAIRNSIGMTNVNFKLDAEDPDPGKSIEIMMAEVVRSRQLAFPLNTSSPADIVYQLQRGGFQFSYDGHPGLPDVKVEFSERNTSYPKPDTDLEENLRKRGIQAFGLNPETVDSAFNSELATTVTHNNILLSRRVQAIQDQFMPLVTRHLVQYIQASEYIMSEITQIIENSWDKIKIPQELEDKFLFEKDESVRDKVEKSVIIDYLIEMFLRGLSVNLPKPNTTTLTSQADSFENYTKILDMALDAWLNPDFFEKNLAGEISNILPAVRVSVRSYFIRKWMAEEGVMPELAEITSQDSEGKPRIEFWEEQKNHIESLMKSLASLGAGLRPMIKATDKVAKDIQLEEGSSGGGFGGDSFGGGFDTSSGGTDDLGGGDDFGLSTDSTQTSTDITSTNTVAKTDSSEEGSQVQDPDTSTDGGVAST